MPSNSPEPGWGLPPRRRTGISRKPISRIQSWVTGSTPVATPPADDPLTPDSYKVYRLEWSDLKKWLEQKFPGHVLPDRVKINHDSWVFDIPRKLDRDDRNAIAAMRDEIHARKEQADARAITASATGRGDQPPNNAQAANNNRRRSARSPERQRRY
ncbi:hypothetical protein CLAIMM_12634 [Cladophialophora immunda]|nr:hypothetical protein CLAIMM_12634 [Cladophialophora immunda]